MIRCIDDYFGEKAIDSETAVRYAVIAYEKPKKQRFFLHVRNFIEVENVLFS